MREGEATRESTADKVWRGGGGGGGQVPGVVLGFWQGAGSGSGPEAVVSVGGGGGFKCPFIVLLRVVESVSGTMAGCGPQIEDVLNAAVVVSIVAAVRAMSVCMYPILLIHGFPVVHSF